MTQVTADPEPATQPPAIFELVAERTHTFGRNAYLELARKRMTDGEQKTEFLVLSRGYVDENGRKRWTKFVTLPDEADLKAWLTGALAEV